VVVVDADLLVRVWNEQAEELWGVRRDEAAGRNLLSLDIGLPLDQVRPLVMALMSGDREEVSGVLPAVNRRGRPVLVTVTGSPLRDADAVTGVILVMEAREDSAGGETSAGEDETAEPAEQAV
jgi:two-component system CheB/CheR fusion protein